MNNEKEVLALMDSLSNWGRWGGADELGTINFITKDKTASSKDLIKEGVSITLSRAINTSTRPDMTKEAVRYMIDDGEGRENIAVNKIHKRRGALEFIGMVFHGEAITHIDAPSHYFWKGKMYNNRPADTVSSRGGAGACDADILKNGIFTKGILLDIPASKEAVSVGDLEEAEKNQGVKVSSGDVLLVRTGNGLAVDTTRWLREREVAVVGSGSPNEFKHDEFENIDSPFHTVSLCAMGLWILDNCDLEELARVCAEKKRWEFALFIAPLRLKNATGSPVNPIAIF